MTWGHVPQVFEEVALWPHPDSGSRLIVNIGGLARPFQVASHLSQATPNGLVYTLSDLCLGPAENPHPLVAGSESIMCTKN